MSTYYDLEAELIYSDKPTMEKALAPIRKGGWLREDNTLVSEGDDVTNDGNPVVNGLVFTIPVGGYRNLGRETYLAVELAEAGHYKEASTDGDCYFSLWQNGEKLVASDDDIAQFLDKEIDQDLFTLDNDEYETKFNKDEDEYWEMRNEAFYDAMESAFVKLDGFGDEDNDYQIINHCKNLFERKEIVFNSEESVIFNDTSIQTLIRMQKNGSFKTIPDYMNDILIRKGNEKQEVVDQKNAAVKASNKKMDI